MKTNFIFSLLEDCCFERVKIFYEHEEKAAGGAMKRVNINMAHKYLGTQRHGPTVNL